MADNLPISSPVRQDENRNSFDLNFSDKNKMNLLSLISEFNNKYTFSRSSKDENNRKVEAISNALLIIEKLEVFKLEYLVIKDKLEESNKEYLAKLNEKMKTISDLEEKNKINELQAKNKKSKQVYQITTANECQFYEGNSSIDKDLKRKYQSAIEEKDKIINEKDDRLKEKDEIIKQQAEEILKLNTENEMLRTEKVNKSNEIKLEERIMNLSIPIEKTS